MNSPQSPCALEEPRSAVERLRASSRELLVESAERADESFEPGDAGFRVALRLLHLLAEFLDLGLQRREQSAEFLLAAFGEGFCLGFQNLAGQRLELIRQRLPGSFQQRQLFRRTLPLLAQLGLERADAGRSRVSFSMRACRSARAASRSAASWPESWAAVFSRSAARDSKPARALASDCEPASSVLVAPRLAATSPRRLSSCCFSRFAARVRIQYPMRMPARRRDRGNELLHDGPASSPNVRLFAVQYRGGIQEVIKSPDNSRHPTGQSSLDPHVSVTPVTGASSTPFQAGIL